MLKRHSDKLQQRASIVGNYELRMHFVEIQIDIRDNGFYAFS